jgi:hypothetical protein
MTTLQNNAGDSATSSAAHHLGAAPRRTASRRRCLGAPQRSRAACARKSSVQRARSGRRGTPQRSRAAPHRASLSLGCRRSQGRIQDFMSIDDVT